MNVEGLRSLRGSGLASERVGPPMMGENGTLSGLLGDKTPLGERSDFWDLVGETSIGGKGYFSGLVGGMCRYDWTFGSLGGTAGACRAFMKSSVEPSFVVRGP